MKNITQNVSKINKQGDDQDMSLPNNQPIILRIQCIECTDLKNVESFGGKNDVYVILTWSGSKFKSDVKHEAGIINYIFSLIFI